MATTISYTGAATSSTWTHGAPHFYVQASLTSSGTLSISLYTTSTWVSGASYYGYTFKVYVNGSAVITYNGANSPYSKPSGSWSGQLSNYLIESDDEDSPAACTIGASCSDTTGCDSGLSSSCTTIMIIEDNSYTAPKLVSAKISAITGTTMTLDYEFTKGTDTAKMYFSVGGKTKSSKSTSGSLTVTGLSNATSYSIEAYVDDGTTKVSKSISAKKTYGVSVSITSTGVTSLVVKCKYSGHSYSGNISFTLGSSTYTVTSGTSKTITGLSSSTTYSIHAWLADSSIVDTSGNYDATTDTSATTNSKTSSGGSSYDVTGTTILLECYWTPDEELSYNAYLYCGGYSSSYYAAVGNTSNYYSHRFTGLSNATQYYCEMTVTDSEGDDVYSDWDYITTYGCMISFDKATTRTATFTMGWRGHSYSGNIHYDIGDGLVTGSASPGQLYCGSNYPLEPSTTYTIKIYLDNSHIVNSSGNYDATYSCSFTTGAMFSGQWLTSNSTGTTIAVAAGWTANDSTGVYAEVTLNGETATIDVMGYGNRFYGLEQGTEYDYEVVFRDDEGNELYVEGTEITYGAVVYVNTFTTRTVTFTMYSIGHSFSGTITYTISGGGTTVTGSYSAGTYYVSSSFPLSPSTSYTLTVYLDGIQIDGVYDATDSTSFTTGAMFSNLASSATSTGTTASIVPTWSDNDSFGIYATVSINGKSDSASNGDTAIITGLTNGTTYTYTIVVTDAETNTLSITGTITTYKVVITVGSVSTKIIQFSIQITHGDGYISSKTLSYYVSGGNADSSIQVYSGTSTGTVTYNYLDDITTYTITAYVTAMYDLVGNLDTLVTATMTTKELTLANTGITVHQHSIVTTWQAYGNGANYDKDNIDGQTIEFTSDCNAEGIVQNLYQTPAANGTTTGQYQVNKTLISSDLDYYAKYIITAYVTDGHNIASASVTDYTTFPFMYVYYNNAWHKAMPYVYENGVWTLAPAFIYDDGEWRECDGE